MRSNWLLYAPTSAAPSTAARVNEVTGHDRCSGDPKGTVAAAFQGARPMSVDGCRERLSWSRGNSNGSCSLSSCAFTCLAIFGEPHFACELLGVVRGVPYRLLQVIELRLQAVGLRGSHNGACMSQGRHHQGMKQKTQFWMET